MLLANDKPVELVKAACSMMFELCAIPARFVEIPGTLGFLAELVVGFLKTGGVVEKDAAA